MLPKAEFSTPGELSTMTLDDALLKAEKKYGETARIVYDSGGAEKACKIFRKPRTFREWLESEEQGFLVAEGWTWENAIGKNP